MEVASQIRFAPLLETQRRIRGQKRALGTDELSNAGPDATTHPMESHEEAGVVDSRWVVNMFAGGKDRHDNC